MNLFSGFFNCLKEKNISIKHLKVPKNHLINKLFFFNFRFGGPTSDRGQKGRLKFKVLWRDHFATGR